MDFEGEVSWWREGGVDVEVVVLEEFGVVLEVVGVGVGVEWLRKVVCSSWRNVLIRSVADIG